MANDTGWKNIKDFFLSYINFKKVFDLCTGGMKNTGISHKVLEKVHPTDIPGTQFFC